jgi:hypothetical protein
MGLALDNDRYIPTGDAGAKWSGQELTYTEFTANASITATTEGTANTIVTAPSFTADGKNVMVEFFSIFGRSSAASVGTFFALYQGVNGATAASIGQWGQIFSAAGGLDGPVHLSRRLQLTLGSAYVFSARAWVTSGTGTIFAGAGGSGANIPGFIRITRA